MRSKWSKCFFCLEELGNLKRAKKRKDGCSDGPAIKLLLHYLLKTGTIGEGQANELLLENVLDVVGGNQEGPHVCENCQSVIAPLCRLHLQLEEIQMKIINLVETVRNRVLNSSITSSIPTFLDAGIKQGEYEESSGKQEESDVQAHNAFSGDNLEELEEDRKLMNISSSFQKAVAECKLPLQVPYVLLEKRFDFPRISVTLSQTIGEIKNKTFILVEEPSSPIVKTEPEETPMETECNYDSDFHHPFIVKAEEDLAPAPSLPPKVELDDCEKQTRKMRKRVKIEERKPEGKKKRKGGPPPKGKRTSTKKAKLGSSRVSKSKKQHQIYTCDTCPSYECRYHYQFQFHLRQHETGEKRFHCDTCPNDLWISGQQLYDFHMDCHHRRKHVVVCDFCHKKIDTFLLKDHMITCSKGLSPIQLFSCVNCSFSTSVRGRWVDHLRKHDRSAKMVCDICLEEFPNLPQLLKHLFQVHQAVEEMKCSHPTCEMTFFDSHSRWKHEPIHTSKFVCRLCDKPFESLSKLEYHLLDHTGKRPFNCDECGKGFKLKAALQYHLDAEHNSVLHKCQFCDKSYRSLNCFRDHMRIHTGEAFSCDQCGVQCVSQSRLKRHMIIHSAQKNYVCEQCGKSFRAKYGLAKHRKTHSTERPFKCEHCDKAFRLNCFLVEHLRSHTGERPYVCDVCGAGFTQKHSLNFHKKRHEQEQGESEKQ